MATATFWVSLTWTNPYTCLTRFVLHFTVRVKCVPQTPQGDVRPAETPVICIALK